jgi:hypothetical protein
VTILLSDSSLLSLFLRACLIAAFFFAFSDAFPAF